MAKKKIKEKRVKVVNLSGEPFTIETKTEKAGNRTLSVVGLKYALACVLALFFVISLSVGVSFIPQKNADFLIADAASSYFVSAVGDSEITYGFDYSLLPTGSSGTNKNYTKSGDKLPTFIIASIGTGISVAPESSGATSGPFSISNSTNGGGLQFYVDKSVNITIDVTLDTANGEAKLFYGTKFEVLTSSNYKNFTGGTLSDSFTSSSSAKEKTFTVTNGAAGYYTLTSAGTKITINSLKLTPAGSQTPTTYTLTLEENGGTYASGYVEPTFYTAGTELTLPTASEIAKENNTFGGWYENADFSGVAVEKIPTTATGNKTYYAKWTENAVTTYKVTYISEGSVYTEQQVIENALTVAPEKPQKIGYAFGGWYKEDSLSTLFDFETETIGGDITLYAKWTEIHSEIIRFKDLTAKDTAPSTASNPFYAWVNTSNVRYSQPTGTEVDQYLVKITGTKSNGSYYKMNNGLVFNSQNQSTAWKTFCANNTSVNYTFNFNLQSNAVVYIYFSLKDEIVTADYTYSYNGATGNVLKSSDPSALTGIADVDPDEVNRDKILVIKQEIKSSADEIVLSISRRLLFYQIYIDYGTAEETNYSVSFDAGAEITAKNVPGTMWVSSKEKFTVPTTIPTRTNYLFSHWVSDNGVEYYPGNSYDVISDLALTAVWELSITGVETLSELSLNVADAQAPDDFASLLTQTARVYYNDGAGQKILSVGITWNVTSAIKGGSTVDLSVKENRTEGTYTVSGILNDAPTGYRYSSDDLKNVTVSVIIFRLAENSVTASAGFSVREVEDVDWHGGIVLGSGYYELDNNGGVKIEVKEDNAVINNNVARFVGLKPSVYNAADKSANVNASAIRITLPNDYSVAGLTAQLTHYQLSNAGSVYLLDSNGDSLATLDLSNTSTGTTSGETLTVKTLSFNPESGNEFYILAEDVQVFVNMIVAQAVVTSEEEGFSVAYVCGESETLADNAKYLTGAKVMVKDATSVTPPDGYRFKEWKSGTVFYSPGDLCDVTENTTFTAQWELIPSYNVTFYPNTPDVENEQPTVMTVKEGGKVDVSSSAYASLINDILDTNGNIVYEFVGWYRNSDLSGAPYDVSGTSIKEDVSLYGKWEYQGVEDIIVKVPSMSRTFSVGTSSADILESLPESIAIEKDVNNNTLTDVTAPLYWTTDSVPSNFATNTAGTYDFTATLGALPSGYVFENGVTTAVCSVTLKSTSSEALFTAEYSAYSYSTKSDGTIVYNNDSGTYAVAWTDYYKDTLENGNIVFSRNGALTVSAIIGTNASGAPTNASADTSHGQTAPMVKGQSGSSLIQIDVPSEVTRVKITVYAVRFRANKANEDPAQITITAPDETQSVTSEPINRHTYTESNYGTDYGYFMPFTPSVTVLEYTGNGKFFVNAAGGSSANVYVTGVKVEAYADANDYWAKVTYNANNGTGENYSVDYLSNPAGVEAIVDKNKFVNEGYEFAGWATSPTATASEAAYRVGKSVELTQNQNLRLYAVWKSSFSITYNENNGSSNPRTQTDYFPYGNAIVADNMFDREGYVFTGWNSSANGTGATYSAGQSVKLTSDLTLYAQWVSGKLITAEYSAYAYSVVDNELIHNNSSNTFGIDWTGKYASGLLAKNGNVTITADSASAGTSLQTKPTVVLKNNSGVITVSVPYQGQITLTVYAAVTAGSNSNIVISDGTVSETNDVRLDVNGGWTGTAKFNTFRPQIITKTYTADGTGNTFTITSSSNNNVYVTGVKVGVNVTAQGITQTTYHANDGTQDVIVDYNLGERVVDINRFGRNGYAFAGWSESASGTATYAYGQVVSSMPSDLYATWTPIEYAYGYVVYGVDGVTQIASGNIGTVTLEDLALTPPSYTGYDLEAYVLDGWYSKDDLAASSKWNFNDKPVFSLVGTNESITLYAKLVEKTETKRVVTFDADSITAIEKELVTVLESLGNEVMVSSNALGLPTVGTATTEDGATITVDLSWNLSSWTNAGLQAGTFTVNGTAAIRNSHFDNYSFASGARTSDVSINVTLTNRVIWFDKNNPVPDSPFKFSKSDGFEILNGKILERLDAAIKGYYYKVGNTSTFEIVISGGVWTSETFNESSWELQTEHVFSTTAAAPRGYVFRNEDGTIASTRQVNATVILEEVVDATLGAGFVRNVNKFWRYKADGSPANDGFNYELDSNGGLTVTAIDSADGDETDVDGFDKAGLASMIKINQGKTGVSVTVPKGATKVYITVEGALLRRGLSGEITFNLNGVPVSGKAISLNNTSTGTYGNETYYAAKATVEIDVTDATSDNVITLTASSDNNVYLAKIIAQVRPAEITKGYTKVVSYYGQQSQKIYTDEETLSPFADGAKVELKGVPENLIPENYVFAGWSVSVSSTDVVYLEGDVVDISDNLNLYAVFEPDYYFVRIHKNDGITPGETLEVKIAKGRSFNDTVNAYGFDAGPIENIRNRVGYTANDTYYLDVDCTTGSEFNANYAYNDDVDVYVKWDPIAYTVKFKSSIDIIAMDAVPDTTLLYGGSVASLSEAVNTDGRYSFRGWFADIACERALTTSTSVNDDNGFVFNHAERTVTVYAGWGAVVTFDNNAGKWTGVTTPGSITDTTVYPVSLDESGNIVGSTYSFVDENGVLLGKYKFGLIGHTHLGWNTNAEAEENDLIPQIELRENVTVYAVWRVEKYDITLNLGDGIEYTDVTYNGVSIKDTLIISDVLFDTVIDEPVVTSDGFIIYGWYKTPGFAENSRWVFDGPNPNTADTGDDITLYARWGVTVKYSTNITQSSSWLDDDKVALGSSFIPPIDAKVPRVAGYVFDGWYTASDHVNSWDNSFVIDVGTVNVLDYVAGEKAIYIHAKYTESQETYQLSFDRNGVTDASVPAPKDLLINTEYAFTADDIPASAFAEFIGWNTLSDGKGDMYFNVESGSEVRINTSIVVSRDIKLYAIWSIELNEIDNTDALNASLAKNPAPTVTDVLGNVSVSVKRVDGTTVLYENRNFTVTWNYNATVLDESGNETSETVNLANGLIGGYYKIVGFVNKLNEYFTWAKTIETDGDRAVISVTLRVSGEDVSIIVVSVGKIVENIDRNSDYRLTAVDATAYYEGSPNVTFTYRVSATWNSQIDSSIVGTHYVEGKVSENGFSFDSSMTDEQKMTSATVTVSENGVTDPMVYKIYQGNILPSHSYAPATTAGYKFLCWTNSGISAYRVGDHAPAGEYTAIYADLDLLRSSADNTKAAGAIRLNADYTGLRFSATLRFYDKRYVGSLLAYNSAIGGGVLNVSMRFTYNYNGSDITIGGDNFSNIIYSVNADGSAEVTYSGVISDLLSYNADGTLNSNQYASIVFNPTAIVKIGSQEIREFNDSAYGRSAKEIAEAALSDTSKTWTDKQRAVLNDYAI